jgi:hypothetical protein
MRKSRQAHQDEIKMPFVVLELGKERQRYASYSLTPKNRSNELAIRAVGTEIQTTRPN